MPSSPVPGPVPPEAADVVAFWHQAGPQRWFAKDADFDAAFSARYMNLHMAAARREREDWLSWPEGSLALLVLLDQFPRNAFRGTGHMFATDGLALAYAHRAIEAGHDRQVQPALQPFFYLPLQHAEDRREQARSVALSRRLDEDFLKWAVLHQEIIERFGRFPHRNPLLGRVTTPQEQAFLDEGGFAG
ncbi:DUF924 family protein [Orrella sp. JC864]|uniref:DUF924 family protein n=1 Tax=Orrella sp. JC864 TaxID=3120298 RepID=UPI0012BC06E1